MKALLLTTEQYDATVALLKWSKSLEDALAPFLDDGGEIEDLEAYDSAKTDFAYDVLDDVADSHFATIDASRAVDLGEGWLDGTLVAFGDGCDDQTWEGVFDHLTRGYAIDVLTREGETIAGYCTSVNPNVVLTKYSPDMKPGDDPEWNTFEDAQDATVPLERVAGITIH